MVTVIAVFAPGQGAQSPGMLAPWLELPGVAEQLAAFSDVSGLDLHRLGTSADADEIKDTAVTQPLLVCAGVIAAGQLGLGAGRGASGEQVVAGHSVGELTAAAVAAALSDTAAVAFAARRGAEMAAACALTPTGMSAVLGGDEDAVAAASSAGLTPANRNAAGQIVAAGAVDALASWPRTARPGAGPTAGRGRRVPHRVHGLGGGGAGARTDGLETPTRDRSCCPTLTAGRLDRCRPHRAAGTAGDPRRSDGTSCMRACADLGVTAVVELAPGGVLAGIAKREAARRRDRRGEVPRRPRPARAQSTARRLAAGEIFAGPGERGRHRRSAHKTGRCADHRARTRQRVARDGDVVAAGLPGRPPHLGAEH